MSTPMTTERSYHAVNHAVETVASVLTAYDYQLFDEVFRINVRILGCRIMTAEIELKDALAGRNDGYCGGIRRPGLQAPRRRARRAILRMRHLISQLNDLASE